MRRARSKTARATLAWFGLALLLGQLILAGLIERAWPEVRDPEWAALVDRLRRRRAEAPGRELVVVLGSSRSEMALDAARLSRAPAGVLVFNAAVPGCGPLVQQVLLERLLAAGLRPGQVVLEVMPPFFSADGACFEESFPAGQRLTLAELLGAAAEAREPGRLVKGWLKGRLLPACYHQAALQRRLLPAGWLPAGDPSAGGDRDGHGWRPGPAECPAACRAERTRFMLNQYDRALRSAVLFEPRVRRLAGMLRQCREEGIGCVLLVPPENSQFRARTAGPLRRSLDRALAGLAREHQVAAYDARNWLGDEEFMDGHHATRAGAARFTARFEAVVLSPRPPPAAPRGGPARTARGRPGGSRPPGS